MLKALVQDVILRNRPEHTTVKTYGNYAGNMEQEATYNDNTKTYELRVKSCNSGRVRSAKAFVEFIKEDLKRRENPSGKFATVHIDMDGGHFTADDNYNTGNCEYVRLNSEQYNILNNYRDKVLDHEGFLIMLQKLKPSIEDFHELYKRFSKIRAIGTSRMTSNPVFDENGDAEASFTCTYSLTDGTDEDVSLPAGFMVTVPFVKAGEKMYSYDVELLFINTKSNEIAVKVQIPNWETQEEQAIIDEAVSIKGELEELSELLVLADF